MEPENEPHADNAAELAALKAKLAATETALNATAATLLAGVPEHLKALVPSSLSPADKIAWFTSAKATGVFDKPAVPSTDAGKPAITPPTPDTNSLPVHARMAAGYRK